MLLSCTIWETRVSLSQHLFLLPVAKQWAWRITRFRPQWKRDNFLLPYYSCFCKTSIYIQRKGPLKGEEKQDTWIIDLSSLFSPCYIILPPCTILITKRFSCFFLPCLHSHSQAAEMIREPAHILPDRDLTLALTVACSCLAAFYPL